LQILLNRIKLRAKANQKINLFAFEVDLKFKTVSISFFIKKLQYMLQMWKHLLQMWKPYC